MMTKNHLSFASLAAICLALITSSIGCREPAKINPPKSPSQANGSSLSQLKPADEGSDFPWPPPASARRVDNQSFRDWLVQQNVDSEFDKELKKMLLSESKCTSGSRGSDYIYQQFYTISCNPSQIEEYYMGYGLHLSSWTVMGIKMKAGWDIPGKRFGIFLKPELRTKYGCRVDENAAVSVYFFGENAAILHSVNVDVRDLSRD